MEPIESTEITRSAEQAAIEASFYCVPMFLNRAIDTDPITTNLVGIESVSIESVCSAVILMAGKHAFLSILQNRPWEQQLKAFTGLKSVVEGDGQLFKGSNRFRQLQFLTSVGQPSQIDGFPNPKDIELFAVMGMLLLNERGKAICAAHDSGEVNSDWLSENEAQIVDVTIACRKIQEAYNEGKDKGVSEKNKNAAVTRHTRHRDLEEKLVKIYWEGVQADPDKTHGIWKSVANAGQRIYDTHVTPLNEADRLLTKDGGPDTICDWIFASRKAKGLTKRRDKWSTTQS